MRTLSRGRALCGLGAGDILVYDLASELADNGCCSSGHMVLRR